MNNPVSINSAFPFDFCQHCDLMRPEAERQTLYADATVCINTVTVYCMNESICQYVGRHIQTPDPEKDDGNCRDRNAGALSDIITKKRDELKEKLLTVWREPREVDEHT